MPTQGNDESKQPLPKPENHTMHPFTARHLICATLLCLANLAHAQASSSVTPPMRADVRFSGTDAGGRGVSTLSACLDQCKSTPGCNGFSFWAGWDATKSSCLLLAGNLTEVAQAKWVSCRMPCTPAPRASVLPQRLPVATLRDPAAPTLSVPARLMPPPPPPPPSDPKK